MKKLATALILAITATATLAQPGDPRRDIRQDKQENRIQHGVQSGSLTQQEAGRLEKGQMQVQRVEDKAQADGTVTRKEKARIEQAQDRQDKRIRHEKHDRQHDFNHDGKKDRPHGQRPAPSSATNR